MYQYLFFDDQKLFVRKNLERRYGVPELIADSVYHDGHSSTDWRTGYVFKTADGKYRMIYQGKDIADKKQHCFIAVSDDGIHFEPEDVTDCVDVPERVASNELLCLTNGEIADIIEDPYNTPKERYKMLLCHVEGETMTVHGNLMTSPDLLHWEMVEGVEWNGGAEPITGVFYNTQRECFTLILRPDWGVRRIGYVETRDWRTYTPYTWCLQVDSLDAPLSELYGMPSVPYGGIYLGFPLLYSGFAQELRTKYYGGLIQAELAYSLDGHHWQRSLRTPFITGMDAQNEAVFGYKNPMLWPSSFREDENGDMLIYASVSGKEHGPAFENSDMGRIAVWRVRKNGVIALSTVDENTEGVLATRENIWQGGELHINLQAKHATVAIYECRGDELLSATHLLEGYTHEDCVPFTGDSTDWVPTFKNGKTLDALAGKTLVLEVRLVNGSLYSISGDCIPVMNLQANRYRILGITPEKFL